jgi:predicted nucleic-acid-binding protein
MGLIVCKNFKEVPVFWNFFQGSVRKTMIQRLVTNGQDKDAWRKTVDEIVNLLYDDTMLTLENTSVVMKHVETYLNRETTTSDNHAVVLKADESDFKEILALKAELADLKVAQATVTTTQGQDSAHRLHNKRRRDGGAHTVDKAAVDACKTCGNRHPGRPCWMSLLMSHPSLLLRVHTCIIKDILLPKTSVITSGYKVSQVTLFSIINS